MDAAKAQEIERAIMAAENEDPDALRAVLSNAPTWHTPTHNMLGGDHMGREQIVQMLKDYRDETGGTLHVEELAPVEARGDTGVAHLRMHARREGLMLEIDTDVRFRVEDGRVVELWTAPRDVGAWDRFWAP